MKLSIIAIIVLMLIFPNPHTCDNNAATSSAVDGEYSTSYNNEEGSGMDENATKKAMMTFDEIEKSLRSTVTNLLKRTFPFLLKMGTETKASTLCMLSLGRLYFAIPKLEEWAFRMLDASGKISGGLLEGTSMALGDYDECLDVVIGGGPLMEDSDTGSYCLVESKPSPSLLAALKEFQVERRNRTVLPLAKTKTFLGFLRKVKSNPNHVTFRLGLCMPSTCSRDDVQNIVDMVLKDIPVPTEVVRCESSSSFQIETHQRIILGIILALVIFVIAGTVTDCVTTCDTDNMNQSDAKINSKRDRKGSLLSLLRTILLRFSVHRNTLRLVDCSVEGDALDPLRGLKVITVILTIFTHTYALAHPLHMFRFRDALNFFKFIDTILFASIANSSVGVETFFFIAGFLVIYNRWRQSKRSSAGSYIVRFITIHYIRIILLEILAVCLFLLLPLLGSGPLWHDFMDGPIENCQKKWWMNLLFIQNFLGPYDSCLYHTWILAAIMQITIVIATVVWAMARWPVIGVLSNVVIIAVAMIAVAVVTGVAGYPATFAVYFYDYRTSITIWKYLYVQAYNHIGPFCIGMLTAYFATEHSAPKISKPVATFCWMGSAVTCIMIVFGLHGYRDGLEMDRGLAVFYAAVHRPAWALALGWVMYSCATGYGGVVNSFLSWRAFVPLERLCYLAYLLHIPLMYYHGAVQRERIYMGHYNQIMSFVSYAGVSFFVSSLCFLLFQAPYESLEAMICGKRPGTLWQVGPLSESEVTLSEECKCDIAKNKNESDPGKDAFVEVELDMDDASRTHM